MCGIAGYSLTRKDAQRIDRVRLTSAMLSAIESRGRDASGMAWWNTAQPGKIRVRKTNVSASRYIKSGRVKAEMGEGVNTAILHTRWATQGSPSVNGNNHPIMRPPVVLVHNGHVSNDDDLFTRLGVERQAEVDSEAIAALLATDPAPLHELLPSVRGRAAVAWMDKRHLVDSKRGPVLHVARITDSPLAVGQTRGGSFFFASTMSLLHKALDEAGVGSLDWEINMGEGERMEVRNGIVSTYESFQIERPAPVAVRSSGSWHFGTAEARERASWDWDD